MKWYQRLFWKIFAAIWVTSLLVLVGTVVLIGLVAEKDRFQELLVAKATGYAELMIERYERRGFQSLPAEPHWQREKRRFFQNRHRNGEGEFRQHLHRPYKPQSHLQQSELWGKVSNRVSIIDPQLKRTVIAGSVLECPEDDLLQLTLSSQSGRSYQVDIDVGWEHSPLAHMLNTLVSVQMALILLVSGLAAFFVSLIIVQPLERLRAHTQAISAGELSHRTDQKLNQRQDELGELAREFDAMADYVQQTIHSHQRLMQDVSHELRAPLARLQAAAGLAELELGQEHKIVERISRECQRLDLLIGEILSLSRLEQEDACGETFSLVTFLNELVQDAQFAHPKRHFSFQHNQDCQMHLNPKLLERAMNNILGNACKHTTAEVAIELHLEVAEWCIIRVRDQGAGVDDKLLSQLCQPFVRGTNQSDGYGLGLSITQRAVARLGGELQLCNHPQGGLDVQIQLPYKK